MKAMKDVILYFLLLIVWCSLTHEYGRVMNTLIIDKTIDSNEEEPWQCKEETRSVDLSITHKILLHGAKTFNSGACIDWRNRVWSAQQRSIYPNPGTVILDAIAYSLGLNLFKCIIIAVCAVLFWTFFPYLYFVWSIAPVVKPEIAQFENSILISDNQKQEKQKIR